MYKEKYVFPFFAILNIELNIVTKHVYNLNIYAVTSIICLYFNEWVLPNWRITTWCILNITSISDIPIVIQSWFIAIRIWCTKVISRTVNQRWKRFGAVFCDSIGDVNNRWIEVYFHSLHCLETLCSLLLLFIHIT